MNRNLHSPTKLTEFARDFDIEPDTFFAKFVNKITNVYNSGYNTVNVVPSRQNFLHGPNASGCSTPTSSITECSSDGLETTDIRAISSLNRMESYEISQDQDVSPLQHQSTRNPSKVVQRISSLMAVRNNNNLSSYKDTELHQFWMPDNKSKECYECSQKFSTFRRKHHCRLCGQIFCSKCCNQVVPGKIINCSGDLKVCTYCSKIVLTYLNSADINSDLKSDLQALQDDLSKKFKLQMDESHLVQESSTPQRKISVGYQEERLLSQPKYLLSNADRKHILQQSTSLKVLYEDVANAMPNQNRGSDIIHCLITKNKSSNKSQAIAILTAMIEAGYIIEIETISTETSTAVRQRAFYFDENEEISQSNPSSDSDILHEFNENAFYKLLRPNEIMSNSGTFNINLDVDNSSVHLSKGSTSVDGLMQNQQKFSSLLVQESDIEEIVISTSGSKSLQEAFCKHEDLLLTQLLRNENLDESWSRTLIPICARIVNTLPPEMIGPNQMDIRNYVNFKKVSDGSRSDSCIVRGVVFSKNVVHKNMTTTFSDARILLLQCPIVYQRVEGKYVTIETLLLQEREYLTNVVGRIRSLNPNIIFVHKNVSGIAQEMLRKYDITLVVDVKLSVLKRLSRCLQCDVVSSIDSNIGRPKLGICEKFFIQTFTNSVGLVKTLMFVETPSNPRSCSVLLRGSNYNELVRVKRVAAFLLFARYNWRLEMSFLLNELARPPVPKPNIFESKDYSPCSDITKQSAITFSNTEYLHEKNNSRVKKSEKKCDERFVNKENVQDFSDPLRTTEIVTNDFDSEYLVKFAVEQPCDNRFRTALNSTILSISPFSHFPLPYLETEIGRKCALRSRFPNELFYSKQWSDTIEKCSHYNSPIGKSNPNEAHSMHSFLLHKIVEPAENREFQTILAQFRASGGMLKKKSKMETIDRKPQRTDQINTQIGLQYKDALDINNHQSLPLLFTYFYYSPDGTFSFCVHPNLLNISYYGDNDIMLGQFLERYCFDNTYVCGACKLPILGHIRRYVHSMGCITVKLNEEEQKHKQITMFSWCSKCKEISKSVTLQKDTYCLSFGKYLELRFHGHAYLCRDLKSGQNDLNTESGQTICSHSIHRDHVQYFSYNGIVASFSYTPVDAWEISLPSLKLKLKISETNDPKQFTDEVKSFSARGYEVFATIYDRLAQIMSDVEFPLLNTLKRTLNNEQLAFREKVGAVHKLLAETTVYVCELDDAVYMMKRILFESIENWTQRLIDASIQYRTICATTAKSDMSSSPLPLLNVNTATATQSHNVDKELQEDQKIDSGTICTEELRSDPESPIDSHKSNIYLNRNVSVDEKSIDGIGNSNSSSMQSNQVTDPVVRSSLAHDKKSVKTILRDLLPNEKTIQPLPSPIAINEHLWLPIGNVPVLVHDQDFSSVIAYSLASFDYKRKLENLCICDTSKSCDTATESEDAASTVSNIKETEKEKEKKPKTSQNHVEMNFHNPSLQTQFTCRVYFAREFDLMRSKLLNVDGNIRKRTNSANDDKWCKDAESKYSDNCNSGSCDTSKSDEKCDDVHKKDMESVRSMFIRSLSKSVRWEARGGKSGSKFCKTLDDQFVLKEMTKNDISKFEYFAPNYFSYINQSLANDRPTLLAKIFGVFKVTIKRKDNVQEKSLLVMENLFYDYSIDNKFDLKGSLRNRLVDPSNQNGEETVLLDENLIQMSWSNPLYMLSHSKMVLNNAINRDATFLEKNEVMDYSLLVGLNSSGKTLVLGIIDYIRTYTLDKRLESLVKTNLMGKQTLPTIVSPKLYRQRFTEAMDRYFLSVPDRWEGLQIESTNMNK